MSPRSDSKVQSEPRPRRRRSGINLRRRDSGKLVLLGMITAGVAHEINGPLAFVSANLQYLREEIEDPKLGLEGSLRESLLEALRDSQKGIEHMCAIATELRSFSRADDVEVAAVDMKSVIDAAVKLTHGMTRLKAKVILDLTDVPFVTGNENKLVQVISNLLVNAAFAIPSGKVNTNEIRLTLRAHKGLTVEAVVRDTGTGIKPEDLPHIFEPFFTTRPLDGGTGLGLFICRSIVRSFGGTIDVHSTVGRGSAFRVSLPIAQ